MEACVHGLHWNILEPCDFFPAVALDLEKNEHAAVRRTHATERGRQAAFRLTTLGGLQRTQARVHQRIEIGRLPEAPKPSAPPVVTDRALGDAIKPSRKILAI